MKIIADIGANHCGSRELMSKMVVRAAGAGIDIVKFQSWRADKLRKDWPDYDNAYAYYKKHELSESDHRFLIKQCRKHGIEPLFSVFDVDTVDFLSNLGMEQVKIPSPDCNSWKLIDRCLTKFKHLIISTGMHSIEEVGKLADFLKQNSNKVTVMHCVSLYPTPLDKVNMMRIAYLMQHFPSVGFSDHTLGVDASKVALCLGVSCVERHYTLDKTLPGKDHAISSLPHEFAELVEWRDKVKQIMYSPGFHDKEARKYIGKWDG